jgi:hypothetical protein
MAQEYNGRLPRKKSVRDERRKRQTAFLLRLEIKLPFVLNGLAVF